MCVYNIRFWNAINFKTAINAINASGKTRWRWQGWAAGEILQKKKKKGGGKRKKNIRKSGEQRSENYSRDNIAGTMAFDARTIPKISKARSPGQRPCTRSRLTMKPEILRAPFSFDNVAVMRRGNT